MLRTAIYSEIFLDLKKENRSQYGTNYVWNKSIIFKVQGML